MIFKDKQLNCILNKLLLNNKSAHDYFFKFINTLPEQILDVLFDCQDVQYEGDDWSVDTFFSPNNIQIEIYYNNASLRLDMCPISHKQINEIPVDNKNDIFLSDDVSTAPESPAFFELIYNPNVEMFDMYDELNIGYYIVKKQEEHGKIGFYLLSQSLDDAGIHSSKIDIEDFIIDPVEDENLAENHADFEDANVFTDTENYAPCTATHNHRRSPYPRNLY